MAATSVHDKLYNTCIHDGCCRRRPGYKSKPSVIHASLTSAYRISLHGARRCTCINLHRCAAAETISVCGRAVSHMRKVTHVALCQTGCHSLASSNSHPTMNYLSHHHMCSYKNRLITRSAVRLPAAIETLFHASIASPDRSASLPSPLLVTVMNT